MDDAAALLRDWIRRLEDLERRNLDPWHNVGDAGEPAFNGAWVNYDPSGFQQLRYRLNGVDVQMEGLVKSGATGVKIFTLPVGYRPPNRLIYTCEASASLSGVTRLDVWANGDVLPLFHTDMGTGAATYISLAGVRFSTT